MFRWSKKKKHAGTTETDGVSGQVTQRFTVNLPNGHKSVVRVPQLTTVADIVDSVCKEKGFDLDLGKFALQIPKKPGKPVDLNATIHQLGAQELNIIPIGLNDRNHTMSMPDLSQLPPSGNQPPSFTTPNGQYKKKRGFLSFLGKKDKKYKSEIFHSMDTSFPSSLDVSTISTPAFTTPSSSAATTPASIQRRGSDHSQQTVRPKSMFVNSNTFTLGHKPPEQSTTPVIAPPRKKRQAPEPPVTENSEDKQKQSLNESTEVQEGNRKNTLEVQTQNKSSYLDKGSLDVAPSQQESGKETTNIIKSLNSSDSSGYCELSLSMSESSKINEVNGNSLKTSTDMASLEGKDGVSMESSNISPMEMLLSDKVSEKSEVEIVPTAHGFISESSLAQNCDFLASNGEKLAEVSSSPIQNSSTLTVSTMASNMTASPHPSWTSVIESTANKTSVPQTDKNDLALILQHQSVKAAAFAPVPQVETLSQSQGEELYTSDNTKNQSDVTGKTELHEMSKTEFSCLDESKTNFDINDILDGIVFDEEPWPMKLTLARKAGIESSDKDQMMMMETASVTSENIDQIENSSYTERPCAFIPPPPPVDPPPSEPYSVGLESFMSTTAPVFVDKATVVSDDNVSLTASSAKSSPGRVSSGSIPEMALFVDEINNMTSESPNENDNKLLTDSINSLHITTSQSNMETKPIFWSEQVDFTDLGSEHWPLMRGNQNLRNVDPETQAIGSAKVSEDQTKKSIVSSETNTQSLNISDDIFLSNKTNDSDDEEYFTEIIEELIIPMGPNGYDFSAAKKKEGSEMCVVHNKQGKNKNSEKNEHSDAKLSSIPTTTYHSQPPPIPSPPPSHQVAQKEKFVLTNDDLSHVSFLPSKIEMTKSKIDTSSNINWSSSATVSIYDNSSIKTTDSQVYDQFQTETAQKSITSRSEPKHLSTTIKEPKSLPKLPTMRPKTHTPNLPAFFDDESYNNDPLLAKSKPHLVMNVSSHSPRRSRADHMGGADYFRTDANIQSSSNNGAGSDSVADNVEQPGSITSAYNDDAPEQQDTLQRRYYALQDQFHQWQEQLAWNQSLLASQAVGSELQSEHLQQLMDQIAMYQQMMEQLQTSMLALQQQQNAHSSEQYHPELSAEFPSRMHQPLAGAAEPTYIEVKGQPLKVLSAQKKRTTVLKAGNTPTQRSKFEKELGPREQLMIAIRSFSKQELKSVPIAMTRWTSSAL